MDNENKVKKLVPVKRIADVHREVEMLLEDELTSISNNERRQFYNLELEFSKTKKNNLKYMWEHMYRSLLICLGLVLLITMLFISFLQNSGNVVDVKVNDYDSLNLSELLTKVSNIDEKIQEAEAEKKDLKEKLDKELSVIEARHAKALKKLADEKIRSKSKRAQREAEIEVDYKADLATVEPLRRKLANCNAEIRMYNEQREQFDAARVQEAEKQQAILNAERFEHEKEKEQMTEGYEAKIAAEIAARETQEQETAKRLEEMAEENRKSLELEKEAGLKRQQELLDYTVNQYDPSFPSDEKIAALRANSKSFSKSYAGDKVALPDGVSEKYLNALASQKSMYDEMTLLYEQLESYPYKENGAIKELVAALHSYSAEAGNRMSSSSIAEIKKLLDEKKAVKDESRQAVLDKERMAREYNGLIKNLCGEDEYGNFVDGILLSTVVTQDKTVYVHPAKMKYFDDSVFNGMIIPCRILNGNAVVGTGKLIKKNGSVCLIDFESSSDLVMKVGSKVIIGEPVAPAVENSPTETEGSASDVEAEKSEQPAEAPVSAETPVPVEAPVPAEAEKIE